MKLDEILARSSGRKKKKRVGRGDGSGMGKTCGRGHKGYGSRSGSKRRMGYEGGQNPSLARLPKVGFNNARFQKRYQCINLDDLDRVFENGAAVDAVTLKEARLIDDENRPVKILGRGELTKKLTISADRFSATARSKIADAGGTINEQ